MLVQGKGTTTLVPHLNKMTLCSHTEIVRISKCPQKAVQRERDAAAKDLSKA